MENACVGSLAGWLAGWQAGQRWLAGWLSWLCEVHFGWVFTRLSDANLLTVWLAAWLAAWLAEFCDVFVWLFHFERVFTWLSDANLCFSDGLSNLCEKMAALAGWLAGWNAIFTQLSEVNRLAVWLAGCLAGWLVEFCHVFVWLIISNVFSHGFPTQIGVFPLRWLAGRLAGRLASVG